MASERLVPRNTPQRSQRSRYERALEFISKGQIGAAAKVMEESPRATLETDDQWQALLKTYVDGSFSFKHVATTPSDTPTERLTCDETLLNIVLAKMSKRNSAGGCSGIRAKDLSAIPDSKKEHMLELVNSLLSNDRSIPDHVRALLRSSRGVALLKSETDPHRLRPIAMGELVCKVAAVVALTLLEREIDAAIDKDDQGHRRANGTQTVLHSLRELVAAWPGAVVLQLDFTNAFGSLRRESIADVVKRKCKRLLEFLAFRYADGNDVWYERDAGTRRVPHKIVQTEGLAQGCPLSPALFSMTLSDALIEVRDWIKSRGFIFTYLDDLSVVVFDPTMVPEAVRRIKEATAKIGLSVNESKSTVFSKNLAKAELGALAASVNLRPTQDLRALGGLAAGDHAAFLNESLDALKSISDKYKEALAEIKQMKSKEAAQAAIGLTQLLADSLSKRTGYLARVTEPSVFLPFAARADWLMLDCFVELFANHEHAKQFPDFVAQTQRLRALIPAPESVKTVSHMDTAYFNAKRVNKITTQDWDKDASRALAALLRVLLPVRMGGLGITSSTLISHPSFVASMTRSEDKIRNVLGRAHAINKDIRDYDESVMSERLGTGTTCPSLRDAAMGMGLDPAIEPNLPKTDPRAARCRQENQTILSNKMYQTVWDDLTALTAAYDTSLRSSIELVSCSERAGRGFVRAVQCWKGNRIDWEIFTDWVALRLGLRPPLPNTCKLCNKDLRDQNPLVHAGGCRYSGINTVGHAMLVEGVTAGLTAKGVRCSTSEPRFDNFRAYFKRKEGSKDKDAKVRADIRTINTPVNLFLDVCVTVQKPKGLTLETALKHGVMADLAEKNKYAQMKAWSTDDTFIPLAFDRLGGMTSRTYKVLMRMRPYTSEPNDDPKTPDGKEAAAAAKRTEQKRLFECISLSLARGASEAFLKMRNGTIAADKKQERDRARIMEPVTEILPAIRALIDNEDEDKDSSDADANDDAEADDFTSNGDRDDDAGREDAVQDAQELPTIRVVVLNADDDDDDHDVDSSKEGGPRAEDGVDLD